MSDGDDGDEVIEEYVLHGGDVAEKVTLTTRVAERGLGLRVVAEDVAEDDGDGAEEVTLYDDTVSRGFFDSDTKVGRVGNELRDHPDLSHGEDGRAEVKQAFTQACREIKGHVAEADEDYRSRSADRVLDMTERVVRFVGPEGNITVEFDVGGMTGSVEFGIPEWRQDAPVGKLGNAIYQYGGPDLDLEEADWPSLKVEWEEEMVRIEETQTLEDQVVESVLDDIGRLSTLVTHRDDALNSQHTAWYRKDASDDGEDVLLVRSEGIQEYLDDTPKGSEWSNQLSRELQSRGLTFGKTQRVSVGQPREQKTFYLFRPEVVGITRDDLPDEENDGMGVEP